MARSPSLRDLFYLLSVHIEKRGYVPKSSEAFLLEHFPRLADQVENTSSCTPHVLRPLSTHTTPGVEFTVSIVSTLLSCTFRLFDDHTIVSKARRQSLLVTCLRVAFSLSLSEAHALETLDRTLLSPHATANDIQLLPELIEELYLDLSLSLSDSGTSNVTALHPLIRRRALLLTRLLQPSAPFAGPFAESLGASSLLGVLQELEAAGPRYAVLASSLAAAAAASFPAPPPGEEHEPSAALNYVSAFMFATAVDPSRPGGAACSEICFAGLADAFLIRLTRIHGTGVGLDEGQGPAEEGGLELGESRGGGRLTFAGEQCRAQVNAAEQGFLRTAYGLLRQALENPSWPDRYKEVARGTLELALGQRGLEGTLARYLGGP